MKKNRIRLSESQLHRIIKESVKNILKERLYLNGYVEKKVADFVNYFDFTIEDVENEINFAYEAEVQADVDESAYNYYYSLVDEVRNTYHVNDVKAQINELVAAYLANK